MAQSAKIAISLPKSLVRLMERERKRTGETRSAFVRRAVRLLFQEKEHMLQVSEYVEGYRAQPETEEEIATAEAEASELFSREPWE
ncbi:MAG: ribbon-helix-helix protein, CopG family [Deltaproteobacteria bacterium]|nr:ribbon-helix-helix protein, CopG family [Deltaproteobacteria bacterium]